jgi:hypothetical protein
MLNTISGLLGDGVSAPSASYESIATVTVGGGGSSSITFTSIPSTYTHLQLRYITSNNSTVAMAFNSDTGSNYSQHYLYGDGSTAGAGGSANNTYTDIGYYGSVTANVFMAGVVDILEYKNTNINKTMRVLTGVDINGSGGQIALKSGNWRNTNAISTITITPPFGTFAQYSSFALYGIK